MEEKEKKIPLKVDSLDISTTGLLIIDFNKPFIKPPIQYGKRILQDSSQLKDLEEFFIIKV